MKPRLALFQFRYPATAMPFQLIHRDEHVRCLAQDFSVTCIDYDCDYREVCDQVKPDVCLFETGLEISGAKRLRITGVRNDDSVPKIALLNSDGCSELRAGILSDVDHWGVSTLFTISLVAADNLRGVADRLFVWPNFVDPLVFRDYCEVKSVPILLTGSISPRYPWRNEVNDRLISRLPVLWTPHLGYSLKDVRGTMPVGESYARLLSSSKVALACGSVSNELVRKHLEIPAVSTCLVAERSPALEAAGFVDMVNCVFAEPAEIVDKVSYLLANESARGAIARAGFQLVHSKHTLQARRQIFEWYSLDREAEPHAKIIQAGPFGSLQVLHHQHHRIARTPQIASGGKHIGDLQEGLDHLSRGRLDDAKSCFLRCLSVLCENPEAKYGMALAELQNGRPSEALHWIRQPLKTILVRYGAEDPDPAEWALLIIVLLCMGRVRAAARRAYQFSRLRHLELDRARWAVARLTGSAEGWLPCPEANDGGRVSIHRIPLRDSSHWIDWLKALLAACGRESLARSLLAGKRKPKSHFSSLNKPGRHHVGARPTLSRADHPDLVAETIRRAASCAHRVLGFGRRRSTAGGPEEPGLLSALENVMDSEGVESLVVLGSVRDLARLGNWGDRVRLGAKVRRYAEIPCDASCGAFPSGSIPFGAPFEAVALVGDRSAEDHEFAAMLSVLAREARLVITVTTNPDTAVPFPWACPSNDNWVRVRDPVSSRGSLHLFRSRLTG